MIIREKKPFLNLMMKCLEKMPIILIVFLFIGCAPIPIRYHPHHDPENDLSLAKVRAANSGKIFICKWEVIGARILQT